MIIALQTLIYFRQSILKVLDRLLEPYYKRFSLAFKQVDTEDEEEEEVYAEFDEEKGVVFFPQMYAQRYAAVSDCLMDERWWGKLEKVVDLGYHDMSFIKYLKEVPGVHTILGVDIESISLRCSSDIFGCEDYAPKRESPLKVTLFQGNAADPDYRLIGCDAVVGIEMIEHMLPQDLDRLVHTVFGFIQPWIVVFTTPNADFNVLFKSLEKNGLRRWDHFFEWTREQFHDWCSNVVTRYPNYTVSCKGIGPGPPGTLQYGCCSQLALFVSKDYHKQQDLDINSLTLVTNVPSPDHLTMGWESPNPESSEPKLSTTPDASLSRLEEYLQSAKQSSLTIEISPASSAETLEYHDKTSQCNLDMEVMRNYLMFNDEDMGFTIVVPRRKIESRVYLMEDVTSRLNCTTCQVKKFSKTTQNLMAKNKIDTLIHTREVVAEIRHLTNMLNFNKEDTVMEKNGLMWYNINWGDNAPYWNQYYKVVREYDYPFETKSEEARIIDLISEEINRLIDTQYDEEFSVNVSKLEIPVHQLMTVVDHITKDVNRVKDLLEWNGYEVVGDVVVHSRLVVDNVSEVSQEESAENDTATATDWDTSEVHSTTASDGSALVPDYHGRALRRALDKKVRQLKTSELANADLSLELDHVVCRLMKLALRTSKARQTPPPTRWMQCKLLDLLTLTEKAIARRKRHFIENYSVKAFEFDRPYDKMALRNLEDDATAIQIVNKYQKLLEMSESIEFSKKQLQSDYCTFSSEQDFYENFTHGKIKDYDINEIDYASAKLIPPASVEYIVQNAEATLDSDRSNSKLKMLVRENFETKAVTSPSDLSIAFDNKLNSKNSDLLTKENKLDIKPDTKISNESFRHKTKCEYSNNNSGNEQHLSKTKLPKHVISKNSYLRNVRRKSLTDDYEKGVKSKRQIREPKKLQPTASKPIPGSIIELCKPEMMNQKNLDNYNNYNSTCCKVESDNNISATEENLLMDIVMDDTEETIALRRTIGTDPDMDSIALEQETVVKITRDESSVNNLQSNIENEQSIFLYDINEPSTSKGVRHVSMDVQCGPDIATPAGAMVSPANSLMRMPKMFSTGIKIGDSMTNLAVHNNSLNFGTCTDYKERFGTPRMKSSKAFSRGIAFGESPHNLQGERPCSVTSINENEYFGSISPILKIPNVLSKTIAINDSLRDIEMKLSSDFGTSARDNRSSEYNNDDANSKQTVIIENNEEENKMFGPVSFRKEALFSKGVNIKNSSNTVTLDSHNVTIEKASEQPKSKTLQIFNVNVEVGRKLQDKVKDKLVCNVNNNENVIRASGKNLFVTSNEDSLANMKTENNHDLGSATDNTYNKISKDGKATGIKIKDSDLNITLKSDCGTSIEVVPDVQTPYTFLSERSSSIDTRLLKAISSGIKTEDSNSESCGSQRSIHYRVSSKPSRNKIKFSNIDRYTDKSRNHMHPYLSCSGVYIHSYKEKLICEDVVFQGEWLRNIPKVSYRKKPYSITSVRKLSDQNLKKKKKISKEKLQYNTKPDASQVNVDLQKVVQVRTPKVIKVKETLKTAHNRNIAAAKDCKLPKPIIKLVKVASRVKCNLSNCSVKSTRLSRIRSRPPPPPVVLKTEDIKVSKLPVPIKRYIPAYLRRKLAEQSSIVNKLNTMPDKLQTRAEEKGIDLSLLPSEQLKKEMIQFSDEARNNINYIVCRNEINNVSKSASDSQESDNTKQNPKKKNNGNKEKRCYSPVSQTSSTCSTPDSVATVKPVSTRPKTNRRHTNTTSPNKSSMGNSESESNTPVRNRKFTKRGKTVKKSDDKQNDNKNNVPESSMKFTEKEPIITSGFTGRQSVYMAQMTNDSTAPANSLSKNRPYVSNKPSIKIPTSEDSVEKKKSKSATNNVNSNSNVHFGSNESQHNTENKKQECPITSTPREHTPVTNRVLSDWFGTTNKNKAISAENGVLTAMRQLVEDRLVFLDKSVTKIVTDSEKNLKDHEMGSVKYNETSSPVSFKTVIGNDSGVNDIDMDALNRSLDINFGESIMSLIDTNPSIPDLDFMSFQSVVSSKYSEYFLADNEDKLNTNYKHNVSSVKDIFERKEPPMTQNPGPLATQAFSGFSMNADPVAGDQPDYSNLIDSEAASLAINVARQTTSEELFVSGRSSDSYESCLIDEDAVVPNWLFNIISQQQSVIKATNIREVGQSGESRSNWSRPTGELPYRIPQPNNTILNSIVFLPVAEDRDNMMMDLPVPIGEPLLDVNGNALETNVGAGAGAGDGRGMHSDHSQDSSGHGTSLSSSDTSSGQQSQTAGHGISLSSSDTSSGQQSRAILIDPSTFTGHYDLLHDAIPSSVGTTALVAPRPESPDPSYRAININDGPTRSGAARTSTRARRNAPFVSDGEADVSSLDTDATDIPSDN